MSYNNQKLYEYVDLMYNTYKDDPNMLIRLNKYLSVQLPKILKQEQQKYTLQNEKKEQLILNQNKFTKSFMKENLYYYINTTELYFYYDRQTFNIIREDDINHKILSTISNDEQNVIQWKYKIKANIMKCIKQTNPLYTTPESYTVQNVLNILSPFIFKTKSETKYFLTIVGDILLKKTNNLVFIVPPNFKRFLSDICTIIYLYTGTYISNQFKYKYHDQPYKKIRLIKCQDINHTFNIKQYVMDMVVVSCYYSIRYNNSDAYLNSDCEQNISQNILYIKNNSDDMIIKEFTSKYIEQSSTCSISWKNMCFLWKTFLNEEDLPNMIFYSILKSKIINLYNYDENTDFFIGITSRYLPYVDTFLKFFEEHFYESDNSLNFELSEILLLFKEQGQQININEKIIYNILCHYIDGITIQDNKYLVGWSTQLWDKINDIQQSLILGDDSYENYKINQKTNNEKHIVSKQCFEEYITNYL